VSTGTLDSLLAVNPFKIKITKIQNIMPWSEYYYSKQEKQKNSKEKVNPEKIKTLKMKH
jgi:translation initiation factor IF-3